jgi:hypothetical protein
LRVATPVPQKAKWKTGHLKTLWTRKTEQKCDDIVAPIDDKLEAISACQEYALEREKLAVDAEARSFSPAPGGGNRQTYTL